MQFCRGIFHSSSKKEKEGSSKLLSERLPVPKEDGVSLDIYVLSSGGRRKKKGELEKEKRNLIELQFLCLYHFYCKCFLINEIVPLPVCEIDLCFSLTHFIWPENFTGCL